MRKLVAYVGDGRTMSLTGYLKLTDARVLVKQLGTGDVFEVDGEKITRGADLPNIGFLVDWALAARFLRIVKQEIMVARNKMTILEDDEAMWQRLFDALGKMGQSKWISAQSAELTYKKQPKLVEELVYAIEEATPLDELDSLGAKILTSDLPGDVQERLSANVVYSVRQTLRGLEHLGLVRVDGDAARLTERGAQLHRRMHGGTGTEFFVYQLKIILNTTKVWRRVEVPATYTLAALHDVIQRAMGWEDLHQYAFAIGDEYYEISNDEHVTLAKIAWNTRKIQYVYDFHDNWIHTINVEKELPADPEATYPRCTGGINACPPENFGGPTRYMEVLAILADPEHPDHAEILAWLGLPDANAWDVHSFTKEDVFDVQ
jgi:hypothetical protein